jgi:hypothetical protein
MRLKTNQLIAALLLAGITLPAYADHGRLASTDRDGWINIEAEELVSSGLVPTPDKPIQDLTNLEVAQMTYQAAQRFYAQAQLPPPLPASNGLPGLDLNTPSQAALPSKSMTDLVEEFRVEIAAMGIEVDKLEARIQDAKDRDEVFAALQQEYLKQTGTEVGGFSRGYMFNYRGFGQNAVYPPMDYNAAMFMEMDLKSIPVPFVLFDARFRILRSIGMYYQDPVEPHYELRWISLSNYNDVCNLTAGDFYKSYTPLTLWNFEVPVYTFIEPTSFNRTRKDVEEWVYMDQGNMEHLRGFQATTTVAFAKDPVLSDLQLQAMAGPMNSAGSFTYSSYFAGSESSLSFFNDKLTVQGTGLLLWQDPNSAPVPYLYNDPDTYAKQYEIGSVLAKATVPLADKADVTASVEDAGSQYNDDSNDPQRVFSDWAMLVNGSLNIEGAHLTAKYLNIGPYFYSPGAQTNRYTPDPTSSLYLSTNMNGLDDSLPGYLNGTPFQGVNRPYFAPYDRLSENILPYGDSSPDREGIVVGFSGEIGERGWLKPQASFTSVQEIQPDLVLNSIGTGLVAVDSTTNTAVARTFTGYEGALTIDFAKAFDLSGRTYDIQFDYKHQDTNLSMPTDFVVDTIIAACDFNIPAHFLQTVVWSAAFEQAQSSGSEYVLGGGSPPTYGEYSWVLDTATLGQYTYTALNLTRQTLAFGLKLPMSDAINFRADYFLTTYNWTDQPSFDRTDQVWRFGYYVKF